jgi:hypothetical protein
MRLLSLFYLRGAALQILVPALILGMFGPMPLYPQSSNVNSNNRSDTLETWNELSNQGWQIYERQEQSLAGLRARILNLERGSEELIFLSAELSESNSRLRTFNEQIAERMQARDMDLYWAYLDIAGLELSVLDRDIIILQKDNAILRQRVIIAGLGISVIGITLFKRKRKLF